MKNVIYILAIALLLISCVDKSPKLNEDDYKIAQQEYETLKSQLSVDKEAFYNENKVALKKKINLFRTLKDSTTVFNDVNDAEDFFLDSISLRSINFKASRNSKGTNAVFISKSDKDFMTFPLKEDYERLYWCETNDTDGTCESINSAILKTFLEVKYVFVVNGYRLIEPTLSDKDNFESGLFIATILVYDIDKEAPLYQYSVSATNNEKVSYMQNSFMKTNLITLLKRDFENNISKSIWEGTQKHFTMASRY